MTDHQPAFHPLDYVSVLRRRVWWLLLPLGLALAAGAAFVWTLPREYVATTTLGVLLPSVSPDLVGAAPRVSPEERRSSITQGIKSPAVLEQVVRQERLAVGRDVEAAVADLDRRLSVTLPATDPSVAVMQFEVAYRDADPLRTQRVTNRLAELFVEDSSRRREVRAEETSAFIATQVDASQTRLSTLEGRLRTAKEAFMGALPEQTNANVAMATGMQQQLETTANAIRGEQDRLSVIERQIEAMKTGANGDPNSGAGTGPSSAAVRLAQLEGALAAARGAYTERHPEVVRLRDEVAAARADAAAESGRPLEERVTTLRIDPTYRALLADQEQARLRIRDLQRHEEQLRSQIGVYRARVDAAPRVEQQFATLQREYDLERQQYSQLATRLRSAEMAERLERSQGGEAFTILARAPLPTVPASPNPQRLMMVALLFGLAAGGGLALGREYLDRSIHDTRALADLDLPILGEIPRIAGV